MGQIQKSANLGPGNRRSIGDYRAGKQMSYDDMPLLADDYLKAGGEIRRINTRGDEAKEFAVHLSVQCLTGHGAWKYDAANHEFPRFDHLIS